MTQATPEGKQALANLLTVNDAVAHRFTHLCQLASRNEGTKRKSKDSDNHGPDKHKIANAESTADPFECK